MYLDGALAARRVTAVRPFGPLGPTKTPGLAIGNWQHHDNPSFNGLIDEVPTCNETLRRDQFLNAAPTRGGAVQANGQGEGEGRALSEVQE